MSNLTEITNRSWFSRLGNSLKGVLFGILLFIIAFPVLFINEGRAVRTARALTEGAGAVIAVPADRVDPANEGSLIHVQGMAATSETLNDDQFGVAVNALHLEREVEIYQWQERTSTSTDSQVGGSERTETTYSYETTWRSNLIDSTDFRESAGHQNPTSMPFEAQSSTAVDVSLGAFQLTPNLVDSIRDFQPLNVESVPSGISNAQLNQGGLYIGENPQSPQVGDMRITFRYVEPQVVSVVAQQTGNSFRPYETSNGRTISMLNTGSQTPEEMFEAAQASNTTLTWMLRVFGIALMFGGVSLVLKPIAVFADFIPFLGKLTGFALNLVAFLFALPLALMTIAIAWIFYRPLLTIALLVIGAASIAGAVYFGKQYSQKQATQKEPIESPA